MARHPSPDGWILNESIRINATPETVIKRRFKRAYRSRASTGNQETNQSQLVRLSPHNAKTVRDNRTTPLVLIETSPPPSVSAVKDEVDKHPLHLWCRNDTPKPAASTRREALSERRRRQAMMKSDVSKTHRTIIR